VCLLFDIPSSPFFRTNHTQLCAETGEQVTAPKERPCGNSTPPKSGLTAVLFRESFSRKRRSWPENSRATCIMWNQIVNRTSTWNSSSLEGGDQSPCNRCRALNRFDYENGILTQIGKAGQVKQRTVVVFLRDRKQGAGQQVRHLFSAPMCRP